MESKKIEVININENRFKAFVMFTKTPYFTFLFKEIEWYSNSEGSILGTIAVDVVDKDFNCSVLCRDDNGKFKAVELKTDFKDIDSARNWVSENIKWIALKDDFIQAQGDENKGIDLFKIQVSLDKLHPYFKLLSETPSFIPAKTMLQELTKFFEDIDGNFVEQFQSTGFDARLWELYMFCFLTEQEFNFIRPDERPDFVLNKSGTKLSIEAVIVSRKTKIQKNPEELLFNITKDVLQESKKSMPLKYSNALTQKLKKKYWELPQVKENPFILAIADFHDDLSMVWSFNLLFEYLYGYKYSFYHTKEGQLVIKPEKVKPYIKANGSVVESGFFFQPDCENISAVLFSSAGTLSKFTRIGIQSGFKAKGMRVVRTGTSYKHDPNSSMPNVFHYEVNESCEETWSEGVNIYHNPLAKFPLDKNLFKNVAHHYLKEDKNILSFFPAFHPYSSIQTNIVPESFKK